MLELALALKNLLHAFVGVHTLHNVARKRPASTEDFLGSVARQQRLNQENPLSETVKPAEVRQRLGDLLDRVADRRDDFVIERRGKPLAAIVPFAKYQQLQRAAEVELLSAFDRHARELTQQQAHQLARKIKRRASREKAG